MGINEVVTEKSNSRVHLEAIAQALIVTILWSSSWVIIKFGLEEIPPLIFAGLRYSIASLILLTLIGLHSDRRNKLKGRPKKWWRSLIVYGLIYIAATQGTQFLALKYLPAITLSLLLNLTPIIVLAMAIPWLKESPTLAEVFFIILSLIGVLIYFYPLDIVSVSLIGLFIGIVSLVANSVSAIIGRAINRLQETPAIIVTAISMSIGSVVLLVLGVTTEVLVPLSIIAWLSILWLAVMNTALAFTLWNNAMRALRAVDTTLINSTMMPQIVILSIIFLNELPDLSDWIGLILLAVGIAAVQILQTKRKSK
jgi:drug/metabolite transporter (DMT)-like permease